MLSWRNKKNIKPFWLQIAPYLCCGYFCSLKKYIVGALLSVLSKAVHAVLGLFEYLEH